MKHHHRKSRNDPGILYFSYGSNLNIEQMARRCPTARPFARALLPDYQLVFRGVADIIQKPGAQVYGALWRIYNADLESLDVYEGVRSKLYRRVWLTHVWKAGPVLTYRMTETDHFGEPWTSYLDGIRDGYKAFNLPMGTLDAAVHASRESGRKGKRSEQPRPPYSYDELPLFRSLDSPDHPSPWDPDEDPYDDTPAWWNEFLHADEIR